MEFLDKKSDVFQYNYEAMKIPYYYKKNKRWYIPDFIIDNKIMAEIKPVYQMRKKQNLAKFAAAREYCKQNNMEFKVLTEIELRQLGVTV